MAGSLSLGLLAGCKDSGGGPGGPGGGGGAGGGPFGPGPGGGRMERGERTAYFLVSSSLDRPQPHVRGLLAAAATVTTSARPCMVGGTRGQCLTPTQARGKVVHIALAQTGETGPPTPGAPPPPPPTGPPQQLRPGRLFGGGEGHDGMGRIGLHPFDLASPKAIPGEGNLQDNGAGTTYQAVDTLFGYLDVQLPVDGKFWTLRFAFYPQPLADDPVVKMCTDKGLQDRLAANGAIIDGAPPFARGDVLYCEKANASDECAPGDFRWLDAAGQFAATRPAQPRQIDFIVREGIECKLHPEGPTPANRNQPGELRLNGFRMGSRLTSPVSVWARFDECNKTFVMKDASGAMREGTSLQANLNYDLDGFVFLPGIEDLASASAADVLRVATLAPLYAREKYGPGPASIDNSRVTLTLALGTEPHAPCDQPDQWDAGSFDGALPAPRDGGVPNGDGPGPQRDGGPGDMDARKGPPPADTADGIHPVTTMPPGCDAQGVRTTDGNGAACMHRACEAPEWESLMYTPWSMKRYRTPAGRECDMFCVSQSCPGEQAGAWMPIMCMPPCN